jgi:ribosomal protein L40E
MSVEIGNSGHEPGVQFVSPGIRLQRTKATPSATFCFLAPSAEIGTFSPFTAPLLFVELTSVERRRLTVALMNCPECAAEVSTSATKCPKCGFQVRKPKRGIFGKCLKYGFVLFNVVMLIWLVAGMQGASKAIQQTTNDAQQAGAVIGTTIGAALIIGLWVAGDVILGLLVLFTRPKG